jgi:NAD(P)-dependent dehydrogenase (short-subunit alcohol dehydrogenase family)
VTTQTQNQTQTEAPGPESKTFLITGVSSGFGRALAVAALRAGHRVVGTVRRPEDAEKFRGESPLAIARLLDVTDDEAVQRTVEDVEVSVAPVDVLVVNAGYGHEGTLEETSMADVRRQFDVNVFGAVATIKAVLPGMRRRRAGRILVITSMGGLITMPGLTAYHGSKFALEGIAESLQKEVAALGIHVTAVAPGSFRTDWAGRSMVRTPLEISDYEEVFGPLRANRLKADGNQLGDPQAAAAAMLRIVGEPNPPAHLVLGSDALRLVTTGRAAVDAEIERWREVTTSTDFSEGAQIG